MKYITLLFLLVPLAAAPAHAQVPITETPLTPDAAAQIVALYNNEQTIRLAGDSRIAAGGETAGNIAVLEGALTVAGHIAGDIAIINGDVIFEDGARVDGTVMVVGGSIRGADHVNAQHILWYRERLKYELRDGELVLIRESAQGELSAGHQFGFGRTDLLVAARGGYNRSEGLPVHIGPRVTLGGHNPTLLEGLFIFRSASAFRFDEHDYGYALRAEQFLGGRGAARVGVRYASEVLPVEAWGLSDRENSLTTFLLHRDYRDHYLREGVAAYLAAGRSGLALDWRLEFGSFRYQDAPLHDPYSLFDNPDPWRSELHVQPVRMRTLRATAKYDTRNEDRDPASGWLVRTDLEAPVSVKGEHDFSDDYRYGLLDIRRYARLSPHARIGLRALASGSITGEALPAFRQQSLGGEGSLPGYTAYEFDCGGHHAVFGPQTRSPYYGCDRLVLIQMEYQARFLWLSRIGRDIGRDFGLLENIRGVLFFDAGRTWNESEHELGRRSGTADFVADAGFGLRFATIGVYLALPLSARAQGLDFFIRLEPRL